MSTGQGSTGFQGGERRVFSYPQQFVTLPEYSAHRGQIVTVIRPLTSDEADGPEQDEEQMYEIRADDGWTGHAFESELE